VPAARRPAAHVPAARRLAAHVPAAAVDDAGLLAGAAWSCAGAPAGVAADPRAAADLPLRWYPATVPGTVAGALRDAGVPERGTAELDAEDWWFRCEFVLDAPAGGPYELALDGVATVWEAWVNGIAVGRGDDMFLPVRTAVPAGAVRTGANELVVCCRALEPVLTTRRPRPRWKTALASHQNLRWVRTSLLGRQPGWTVTPAPIGPWRPVRLAPAAAGRVLGARVATSCRGEGGSVEVVVSTAGPGPAGPGVLAVGDETAPLEAHADGDRVVWHGRVDLARVARWWPHTHGDQPLVSVRVGLGDRTVDLGRTGFRTVSVDRSGGGFTVSVNGVPVHCRGAGWYPLDPVAFDCDEARTRHALLQARDAGMNMVRVPGGTVPPDPALVRACDELGVLLWADCMFGYLDPPEDDAFVTAVVPELEHALGTLAGHPSVAVVCGGQEIAEQAAMFGLPASRRRSRLLEEVVPDLVARQLGEVPYVASSPDGGEPPFRVDTGVCHYFGVGTYRRGLGDLRAAAPRFVSEGLAFAVPPEPATVDADFGGARVAGHDPRWKAAVHHDTGRAWDLDDVRDHYAGRLWEVDPRLLRDDDPERALDVGRATVAELMARAAAEWRRPGSRCDGALVMAVRDLRAGAGWGVVDVHGRPKAPYFALRRAWRPLAVLVVDEGLNGIVCHVVNDQPVSVDGVLTVVAVGAGRHPVERAEVALEVPATGHRSVELWSLTEGFRDLGHAYLFGPPEAQLLDVAFTGRVDADSAAGHGAAGATGARWESEASVVHAVVRPGLERREDVGLRAEARPADDGTWAVEVACDLPAFWVVVDAPGHVPDDSWFHLAPGRPRQLTLRPVPGGDEVRSDRLAGTVRALNARSFVRIVVTDR
jgi:beta-mannosidase